ncbi:hypothetical protein BO94DRAFT_538500 [Aspergillus sclerotioniger CBS 115572]|uniref:Serine hydrolase domain-containing protein n=1 Tax=Aspergillus sclerotioniger CBS 115572 TaxID=1450535 RepID=A0A317VS37_9EURO|nr:hypothetical protein BO94DRAFT_538500 [Aspergillus sclerotioniger CBS 115572]PWY76121.1 hypothetical protein BO94DRAFT_538500 [Aspergillus sclerotioniger CBS 115572]
MSLPRIACFHGGGSNSTIYSIQCAQLSNLLSHDFQLVFFDGPFTRDAGPGVLPAFSNHAPFKSWFTADTTGTEIPDGSGYDASGRDGIERVWKLMRENDWAQEGAVGPWVGAIGFSLGTRVVGGLLLDQQRREEGWGEGVSAGEGIKLKFGVCCMGAGRPMGSEVGKHFNFDTDVVSIPTLHVHGLKDWVLPLSRQQYETYYDSKSKRLYEVDYHHAMPWVKEEVEQLAHRIRQIYKESV